MVFLSWKSRKKKSKFQVGQENFKSTSSTPTPFPVTGNAQIFLRIFNTPLLSKTFFHAQISKMPYAHNLFKIFTSKANKKLICPQNMISRKKKEKKRKEKKRKAFLHHFPIFSSVFLAKKYRQQKYNKPKSKQKSQINLRSRLIWRKFLYSPAFDEKSKSDIDIADPNERRSESQIQKRKGEKVRGESVFSRESFLEQERRREMIGGKVVMVVVGTFFSMNIFIFWM